MGIGITAPGAPLEVLGGAAINDATPVNTTQTLTRLYRPGTFDQSFGAAAELALGRYNVNTTTDAQFAQLDVKLGNNSNSLADQTVMTLRGDGRVGIGTTTPTATLDVNGSTRLRGLATAGLVTTDASGNLSSASAASLDATTASNGLTKTGVDVALGGTLTGATTIAQGSNFFALTGAGQIGLGVATATGLGAHVTVQAASVTESGLEVGLNGSSTAIAFKTEHNGSNFVVRPVSAGGTSTAIENTAGALAINPNGGRVGIGITVPTATLDVSGSTRLRGLTTAGLVTTDASGNLTSASTASFGTSFIQNQNAADQTGNFRISGTGSVGSLQAIGATAAVQTISTQGAFLQWNRSGADGETWLLNQKGAGTTNAGIRFGSVTTANAVTEWARFLDNGNFGIGTAAPAQKLDVVGNIQGSANIAVDYTNANAGTVANTLRFGPTNSGEAIGSKRTAAGNQFGLDFYTTSTARMSISSGGRVGIGTTAPNSLLDLGSGFGTAASDIATKKLALYNNPAGTDFYGFGVSTGQLNFFVNGNATAASAPIMTLTSSGLGIGLGNSSPVAGLHVDRPQASTSTALGVILSGGTSGNPSIELRGNGAVPFIDFVETVGIDNSTRLISQLGTLNVQTSVANAAALSVNGFTELAGVNAAAAPAIATAKIAATMPTGASSQTTVALPAGIVGTKVLSLTAMVYDGAASPSAYPPNNGIPNVAVGVAYQVYLFNNSIIINTNGGTTSSGCLAKLSTC